METDKIRVGFPFRNALMKLSLQWIFLSIIRTASAHSVRSLCCLHHQPSTILAARNVMPMDKSSRMSSAVCPSFSNTLSACGSQWHTTKKWFNCHLGRNCCPTSWSIRTFSHRTHWCWRWKTCWCIPTGRIRLAGVSRSVPASTISSNNWPANLKLSFSPLTRAWLCSPFWTHSIQMVILCIVWCAMPHISSTAITWRIWTIWIVIWRRWLLSIGMQIRLNCIRKMRWTSNGGWATTTTRVCSIWWRFWRVSWIHWGISG